MYQILDFSEKRPSATKSLEIDGKQFTVIEGFLIGDIGKWIYKIPFKYGINYIGDLMFYTNSEGVWIDFLF